jgi:hypothetical protein
MRSVVNVYIIPQKERDKVYPNNHRPIHFIPPQGNIQSPINQGEGVALSPCSPLAFCPEARNRAGVIPSAPTALERGSKL